MKKEVSERDKKMTALMLRWRWVMTGLAGLQVLDLAHHYEVHDVQGWLLPSAWVLPWLTFGCAGTCVFTAAIWTAYLHRPRSHV